MHVNIYTIWKFIQHSLRINSIVLVSNWFVAKIWHQVESSGFLEIVALSWKVNWTSCYMLNLLKYPSTIKWSGIQIIVRLIWKVRITAMKLWDAVSLPFSGKRKFIFLVNVFVQATCRLERMDMNLLVDLFTDVCSCQSFLLLCLLLLMMLKPL